MELTRRDFARGAVLLAGLPLAAQTGNGAGGWFDRPMRWAQLAFVEDDPGNYDPQFWLDYFRRTHSDAACLSAGGCVAFYPTKIPLHYRSKCLGNSDPFGDLVAGCRKLGMNVIARTDPHAAHQDVYDAHPDWIAVDAEGKKRRHWADAGVVGDLRAGPVQLRVHDGGDERDRAHVQGRRHLQQSLGRLRHVLLRALPDELQAASPALDLPRTQRPAGSRAARSTSCGSSSGCSNSGGCGMPRFEDQPACALHRQCRAAAR